MVGRLRIVTVSQADLLLRIVQAQHRPGVAILKSGDRSDMNHTCCKLRRWACVEGVAQVGG